VLDALCSIASAPSSRIHKMWLAPAARYLAVSGLGGTRLPTEIADRPERLHKPAVTEWLKRMGDADWIGRCTLERVAPVRDNVYTVDAKVALPDPFDGSCIAARGRMLNVVEPVYATAALQRELHGDANTLWHVDLATVAARRLGGYAAATLPPHQLRAIVAFRIGHTPLAVHTSHGLPVVSRACCFCHQHLGERSIEDDFHVLFECPLYNSSRIAYFCRLLPLAGRDRSHTRTPTQITARLLSTRDATDSRALGRFLSRVLHTRELFLARLNGHPAPYRPDHEICMRIASDPDSALALIGRSALHVRNWLGSVPPSPLYVHVPSSGLVPL